MENLNCYDNTIRYTDQLLEGLIASLEQKSNPAVLVYIADHADDIFQAIGHNSSVFTFAMAEIPLFVWANMSWREQHPDKWHNLQKNRNQVFTNDLFFESALGLLGISNSDINPQFDITSDEYSSIDQPKTLHGRKKLDAKNNWRYWQRLNAARAREAGLTLIAENVDSVGKAYAASQLNISAFKIQTTFSKIDGYQIISNDPQNSGLPLQIFLSALQGRAVSKLFLSVNNANNFSSTELHSALAVLVKNYSLEMEIVIDWPEQSKALNLASPSFSMNLAAVRLQDSALTLVEIETPYDYSPLPNQPRQ